MARVPGPQQLPDFRDPRRSLVLGNWELGPGLHFSLSAGCLPPAVGGGCLRHGTPLRIEFPGAVYHVTTHGLGRRAGRERRRDPVRRIDCVNEHELGVDASVAIAACAWQTESA